MKTVLPDSIASPEDLAALIIELKEYAQVVSHDAIKQRVSGSSSTQTHMGLTSAARDLIAPLQAKNMLSRETIDGLVKELEQFKRHATTVTLTLAAPPTQELKKTLVAWCRTNLNENVLVQFQFSGTLLGGMVVRAGSRIYDWSLRRKILDERTKFPEVLRRV